MTTLKAHLHRQALIVWRESPFDEGKFWRVHRARLEVFLALTLALLALCGLILLVTVVLPL